MRAAESSSDRLITRLRPQTSERELVTTIDGASSKVVSDSDRLLIAGLRAKESAKLDSSGCT